jgi:serine O-acetyltransferase
MKNSMPSLEADTIKLKSSLSESELARYVLRQLEFHFPDNSDLSLDQVERAVNSTTPVLKRCFAGIPKKYFREGELIHFDHLHSDQYCMYLVMLSRVALELGITELATRLYYLNKVMHSVDIFYRTEMPDIFLFQHPQGSILGRAKFSDHFVMYQGVTVGCLNEGVFPEFQGPCILYANSKVLGNCVVGENVVVAADVSLINTNVPPNSIVMGSYPNYEFRPNNKSVLERPPYHYS